MPELDRAVMERYLSGVFARPVVVHAMAALGKVDDDASIKHYGYGRPVRVDFQVEDQAARSAVFHTMGANQFGHEFMADRAQSLLWAHEAFNHLPLHVRSLDAGAFKADGTVTSLGRLEEICQLTEYVEGDGYYLDLERIRDTGRLTETDRARADALCDYLAEIHQVPGPDPGLYVRRIRELVGHGECIMGLADSYPPHPLIPKSLLEEIEHRCVAWRWRIKHLTHRLRQVHGDFHPWNILFRGPSGGRSSEGAEFRVLDRSRGEWGEPADDVTCLTANYFFFSLQRSGRLEGAFDELFQDFWARYLDATGDREILRVAAPFFAFRGLVLASPVWYPALPGDVRRKVLRFVVSVLEAEAFDPAEVNAYCGG